jgi:CelD/BcsL family acetyltransferase involved in cellulose biosynthesis
MTACPSVRKTLSPPPSTRPIRVDVHQGHEALRHIAGDWDDLCTRAAFSSPHVSRPWAEAWIAIGGPAPKPVAISAWRGDRLSGLLVLAVRRRLAARTARMFGDTRPGYQGVLADEHDPDAALALARACTAHNLFDCLVLDNISSLDHPTQSFVHHLHLHGWNTASVRRTIAHTIRCHTPFDEYSRLRHSPKARSNLRRSQRLLDRQYDSHIDRLDGAAIDESIMSRLADIQYHSWMRRRGAAAFLMPAWRQVILHLSRAGLTRVWILRLDGKDAAFVLATLDGTQRLFYEWTAFDLAYRHLSVGQLLTRHVIRQTLEEGFGTFDFGQGDAAYKRFWATDHHYVSRLVAARGLRGITALHLRRVLWSLAQNRRFIRPYHAWQCTARLIAQHHFARSHDAHSPQADVSSPPMRSRHTTRAHRSPAAPHPYHP